MYQVGSPAMFEGKRFFPETGTPIWKMARRSTVFELCEPEPFGGRDLDGEVVHHQPARSNGLRDCRGALGGRHLMHLACSIPLPE